MNSNMTTSLSIESKQAGAAHPSTGQRDKSAAIMTYTRRRFWPLEPRAEDVDINDIAHALSMLCRFTGHCDQFYSIAEHCVRVSYIVPKELALLGLIHDAAEAYLADLARPVKYQLGLGEVYKEIEHGLEAVIWARYGQSDERYAEIKVADDIMLVTEGRDLMGGHIYLDGTTKPLPWKIVPWGQAEAEKNYLQRFWELYDTYRSRK